MRKLIVSMNVTLNGFMAATDGSLSWHTDLWTDELARAFTLQLAGADTLLLGRKTYEAMIPFWQSLAEHINPSRSDADFNDLLFRHQKVVFSRTLTRTAGWANCRLANRNIAKELKALKTDGGKDVLVYGSGKLVASLARINAIDEYRFWVHPVKLEKGRALFHQHGTPKMLELIATQKFDNGVQLMCYRAIKT